MNRGVSRVLWLIEHVDRELDLACYIRSRIEPDSGITVDIRHIYLDADRFLKEPAPSLLVLPFFYRANDAVIRDMIEKWPETKILTLSFEQIFSNASVKTKIPRDDFTRENVLHHAWGAFYRDHLMRHGVPSGNILLNGNPIYSLYEDPYRRFYPNRDALARKYGLDPGKTWLWVPEDHRYAFFGDDRIRQLASVGANAAELASLRDYSRKALVDLLRWCEEAGRKNDMEVIIRPRPAVHTDQFAEFYREHVGKLEAPIHLIKGESAREWILHSDWIVSAFSTTLIEGALLGKPVYSIESSPTPNSYAAAWHPHSPRIRTRDEFLAATTEYRKNSEVGRDLKKWAVKEMLANGNPLEGLERIIREIVAGRIAPKGGAPLPPRPKKTFKQWLNGFRSHAHHFSSIFHEKDRFDSRDVENRTRRWREALPRS